MPSKQQLSEEATASLDRKDLLRQAYGKATTELRTTHKDEFNTLYAKHAAALGVDWSPRPSDEQKAEAQFADLLANYPHLADRLADAQREG